MRLTPSLVALLWPVTMNAAISRHQRSTVTASWRTSGISESAHQVRNFQRRWPIRSRSAPVRARASRSRSRSFAIHAVSSVIPICPASISAFHIFVNCISPVGADNPVPYAELRLQGHGVITSKVLVSPPAHAWEA
jgi:hypothetical protein